jgi:HK97 gp10 family phage protein
MTDSFKVTAKVEGSEQLLKELASLGGNVRSTARTALRSGTKVIQEQAEQNAATLGTKSGKHTKIKATSRVGGIIEMMLGCTDKFWFFRYFETGTTPHEIAGAPLIFEGDEGLIITGGVSHPGMAAAPWLRPAFDAKQTAAVDAVGDRIRQAIEERRAIVEGESEE